MNTYLRSAYEDLLRAANIEYAAGNRSSEKLTCIHMAIAFVQRACGPERATSTIKEGERHGA